MWKGSKVVLEALRSGIYEKNDIHNEDQNNINKDDQFIATNFEEISKMKEAILNEPSNLRHTEIEKREPLRAIKNNKKNKRMTNLGNYTFESIVRDMTVGMRKRVKKTSCFTQQLK